MAPTGQRLRRRFARGCATADVYASVRVAVAAAALQASDGAPPPQALALAQPGGLVLRLAFPPFAALPEAAGTTLAQAGLARRDKLIARAAAE